MTLQQLKYIVAIDEYKHFGKAAEANDLTQSTLSLMVKKLEEELDVRIFNRNSHPLEPTEMGRKIIDQAKVVLFNVGQIGVLAGKEKESISGPLRIGMISTIVPILVPGMFSFMKENYPDIEMMTEEMLTSSIFEKLRRAEVDMGILSETTNDPTLLEIPLYHERFYAYVSEDNPLYGCDEIRRDDLYEHPIWLIHNGVQLMNISAYKSSEEMSYERFFEGGRVGTLIQLVNENGGITVLPETHVKMILHSHKTHLRPIVNPAWERRIRLVIRKDYVKEGVLNAVIQAVKSIIPADMLEGIVKSERIRL